MHKVHRNRNWLLIQHVDRRLPPRKIAKLAGVTAWTISAWLRRYHYTIPRDEQSLAYRLWSKVVIGEGCWEWKRGTTKEGYGVINVDGHNTTAHRVAWEVTYGPVPLGLSVLHKCDNPPCCRPDHLFLGTQKDNIHDMMNKGRAGWQKMGAG